MSATGDVLRARVCIVFWKWLLLWTLVVVLIVWGWLT